VGHTFDIRIEREGEVEDTFLRTWHFNRVINWLLDYGKFEPGPDGKCVITITGESQVYDEKYVITIMRTPQ
jgi:hypothetical protein